MKITTLLVVVILPSCLGFSTHAPTSQCEMMTPHHDKHTAKPHNTSPYTITTSSGSYTAGSTINVTISGSTLFRGFMVQARREGYSGPPYPIGTFKNPLQSKTVGLWCSGGEPMNTVAHKYTSGMNFTSVDLMWQAPGQGAGNVSFYLTVVQRYDSFWIKQKSNVISGPAAPNPPNVTLDSNFQITKEGCGASKGCYSEPSSCKNSEDCMYLMTYKDNGDNITVEMSTKLDYASVGFNAKQEMNNTDSIFCSKLATGQVVVRAFFLDYHQPLRHDLAKYNDVERAQGVYNNGIVKCRFTRKKTPQEPKMLDLTKNWYFIFAWSFVSSTGEGQYHYANASFTANVVDITKNLNLTNGRQIKPAPTPNPGKLTKTECGKTRGCYSEPRDCKDSDDCDYLLTYQSDKTKITFEMSAKTGWVAVGFNSKASMDGTDTIICSREASGSGVVVGHYNIKGYGAPTKNIQGTNSLKDASGKYESGVLQCKTSRLLKEPGMMDLSDKVFLIFARGPTNGGSIRKHSHKSTTAEKVDVSSTATLTAEEKNMKLLKAHAVLMSLAWLVCASLGMFMARYMKPVWGDVFGKKAWFQFHRLLMVSTLVLTSVGVALAFVFAKGWTEADDAHPIIGIVVLVLTFVQPIMAFFRPGPTDDSRFIFNIAHRSVGVTALVLAVVNCFLGVLLPHFSIQSIGLYPLIVYCVGVFLVLVFEVVLILKNKASYELDQPKAEMKDGKVEVETKKPAAKPENNKGLKKIMFGFLVVLVSGCCLALIILLAQGGGSSS